VCSSDLGRSMSDTQIRIAINDKWLQADEEMFRKVNLQVQEGRVLLTGNVRLPEQRVEAVRLCWQVPGVREVINEIEVSDKSGLSNFARDTWISTQLRSDPEEHTSELQSRENLVCRLL